MQRALPLLAPPVCARVSAMSGITRCSLQNTGLSLTKACALKASTPSRRRWHCFASHLGPGAKGVEIAFLKRMPGVGVDDIGRGCQFGLHDAIVRIVDERQEPDIQCPLLQALHDLERRARTHHVDGAVGRREYRVDMARGGLGAGEQRVGAFGRCQTVSRSHEQQIAGARTQLLQPIADGRLVHVQQARR